MSKLRTFIAINLPPETKREIGNILNMLKKQRFGGSPARVVWEEPEKLHITLVFLGHIPQEKMEKAAKIAKETAQSSNGFMLTGGSLSYFLKERRGPDSIIYLNILDPEKTLRTLYKALFKLLTEAGFYPPERISPHITIGRLKGKRLRASEKQRILSAIADIDTPIVKPFTVDSLNVYESIQSGTTSRYHLLKSFPLGGPQNLVK